VGYGLASRGLSALGRSVVLGLHAGWKFILRGAIHFQKRVHELLQLLGKTFWNPAPPTAMSTQEALTRLLKRRNNESVDYPETPDPQDLRKEIRKEMRIEPTFTLEPLQTPAVERKDKDNIDTESTDVDHTSLQSSPTRNFKRRPSQKDKSAYQVGEIVQGVVIGAIRDSLSYGLYVRLNDGEVGVLPRHKMPGKALRIHIGVGARLQLLVCQVPPKGLTLAYQSHLRD